MASPPSPDLSFLGLLQAAARYTGRQLEERLKATDINVTDKQAVAMLMLDKHPDCTQRELAALLAMDRTSVSDMVRRMEKTGLLTRTTDEKDTRARRLQLTPVGRKMVPTIRRAEATVTAYLKADMPEIEQTLRGVLG